MLLAPYRSRSTSVASRVRITFPAFLCVLVLSFLGVRPAFPAEAAVLNIYNWADYIGKTTVARFERETGIKVNYDI